MFNKNEKIVNIYFHAWKNLVHKMGQKGGGYKFASTTADK
jgi:hypothetical protein